MSDLSCSICDSPRKKVKLIVGKRGNICGSCFEQCRPEQNRTDCIICGNMLEGSLSLNSVRSICQLCKEGCTQVLRVISAGQTWIIYKESPFT